MKRTHVTSWAPQFLFFPEPELLNCLSRYLLSLDNDQKILALASSFLQLILIHFWITWPRLGKMISVTPLLVSLAPVTHDKFILVIGSWICIYSFTLLKWIILHKSQDCALYIFFTAYFGNFLILHYSLVRLL